MCTTSITLNRRKKGVSTILGTLIFIGILFTSVIPMMLVMNQADTIYTQTVHEMESRDQERASEKADAYAYPINGTSNQLKIRVSNKGVVPIKIIRAWINDEIHSQDEVIRTQETAVLGPFTVTLVNSSTYAIKVTTERANSYASTTGTLYYTDGYWFTPSLGIHVLVLNWFGKYQIRVYNGSAASPIWQSEVPYETQGIDIGDVEWTEVGMDTAGYYWVEVLKKIGGDWKHVPGSPIPVVITWPGGSPVINVIADGRGF